MCQYIVDYFNPRTAFRLPLQVVFFFASRRLQSIYFWSSFWKYRSGYSLYPLAATMCECLEVLAIFDRSPTPRHTQVPVFSSRVVFTFVFLPYFSILNIFRSCRRDFWHLFLLDSNIARKIDWFWRMTEDAARVKITGIFVLYDFKFHLVFFLTFRAKSFFLLFSI